MGDGIFSLDTHTFIKSIISAEQYCSVSFSCLLSTISFTTSMQYRHWFFDEYQLVSFSLFLPFRQSHASLWISKQNQISLLEVRLFVIKSICLTRFSPFAQVAQCWEVRIHFEITCGEQPFPIKNNKSLKVSLSPIGFSKKFSVCPWARF